VAVVAPTLLRMVIHEGRNRQIRRMCEAVGHPVLRLVRTRIGPITDPSLGPGSYRTLSFDEVRSLATAAVASEAVASEAVASVAVPSEGAPSEGAPSEGAPSEPDPAPE
jgi:23S rRNA pseudouridine2605 synthase